MIGFGYDLHRLAKGESLILGGIKIESEIGTVAHSDGDVLIHSIADAILGALGEQDIGEHFPDTDMANKNLDSSVIFEKCNELLKKHGKKLVNIDATIVLEKPKLSPYKKRIREKVAELLNMSAERVNIKATTNEKLDSIGRGEAIVVYSVCLLQ